MPQLFNLRFEYPDDGHFFDMTATVDIIRHRTATSFLRNMPSLRSLHLAPVLAAGKLPETLDELMFLYDYTVDDDLERFSEARELLKQGWCERDAGIVGALTGLTLPANLKKKISVGVTNDQEWDSPGLDDMGKWLPSTKMYCKNEQIEVEMAEERRFEMRMTEFLLRGRIRRYATCSQCYSTVLRMLQLF